MSTNGEPTVSVSVSRKVHLGNYESVDIFFSLNALPVDANEQDMMELLQMGENAFNLIRRKIVEKSAELRGGGSTEVEEW